MYSDYDRNPSRQTLSTVEKHENACYPSNALFRFRGEPQHIVAWVQRQTTYRGYPQIKSWKNFTTAEGGARARDWLYFSENGPLSDRYKAEKDREKYKKWFLEHENVFETTKLFEFWKEDNKEMTTAFRQDFINAYNAVADRTFAIKIREEREDE